MQVHTCEALQPKTYAHKSNHTQVLVQTELYLAPYESAEKKSGEPRRNRTFNPQIKSLLLCQLS